MFPSGEALRPSFSCLELEGTQARGLKDLPSTLNIFRLYSNHIILRQDQGASGEAPPWPPPTHPRQPLQRPATLSGHGVRSLALRDASTGSTCPSAEQCPFWLGHLEAEVSTSPPPLLFHREPPWVMHAQKPGEAGVGLSPSESLGWGDA